MSEVIEQSALTVVAAIRDGAADELHRLLRGLAAGSVAGVSLDFRKVVSLHFGRFVILPPLEDRDVPVPAKLAFESNYDGSLDAHLDELYAKNGPALDRILSYCEGYSGGSGFMEFARKYAVPSAAYYRAHAGLGVKRIRGDAAVRAAIEAWLDAQQRAGRLAALSARQVRSGISAHLAGLRIDGAPPVLGPVERNLPRPRRSYLEALFTLLGRLFYLLWLLFRAPSHERQDAEERRAHPPELVDNLDPTLARIHDSEDQVEQNGLTVLVPIKPGAYRHAALDAALWVVAVLARYVAVDGKLGGLTTIHFARWAVLDDDRLLFFSNYDGSWEAYLGDFIDKVSPWLTVIWTNTKWFPPTRWLFLDGAANERNFKRWTRTWQLDNQLWYSAYPRLSVDAVLENASIREASVGDLDDDELRHWLEQL